MITKNHSGIKIRILNACQAFTYSIIMGLTVIHDHVKKQARAFSMYLHRFKQNR